jgi:hypothetical protein
MRGNRGEEDGIDIVLAPSFQEDLSVPPWDFSLQLDGIGCFESADALLPRTEPSNQTTTARCSFPVVAMSRKHCKIDKG